MFCCVLMKYQDVIKTLYSDDVQGLSSEEVGNRLERDGNNILKQKNKKGNYITIV